MRWLPVLALALPVVASAAPVTLQQQGRLLDPSGLPLLGLHTLVFDVWDAAEGGNSVHQESIQVLAQDGFYTVTLGALGDLDSADLSESGVWLEVRIGERSFGRSPVGFVPLAAVSRDVRGGTADVSEVRINNQVVIASDRSITASDVGADSFSIGSEEVIGSDRSIRATELNADELSIGDEVVIGSDRAITAAGISADSLSIGNEEVIGSDRSVSASSVTADSLSIGGEPVMAGELDLPSKFHRVIARATILGSAHSRGRDPRTVTGSATCPSGTTIINWGFEHEIQFWGSTTHWYAQCDQQGNGVLASLYTQWGYGGHYLECFALCVDN